MGCLRISSISSGRGLRFVLIWRVCVHCRVERGPRRHRIGRRRGAMREAIEEDIAVVGGGVGGAWDRMMVIVMPSFVMT